MIYVKIPKIITKMIEISVDILLIITVIMIMSRDLIGRKREENLTPAH